MDQRTQAAAHTHYEVKHDTRLCDGARGDWSDSVSLPWLLVFSSFQGFEVAAALGLLALVAFGL